MSIPNVAHASKSNALIADTISNILLNSFLGGLRHAAAIQNRPAPFSFAFLAAVFTCSTVIRGSFFSPVL